MYKLQSFPPYLMQSINLKIKHNLGSDNHPDLYPIISLLPEWQDPTRASTLTNFLKYLLRASFLRWCIWQIKILYLFKKNIIKYNN